MGKTNTLIDIIGWIGAIALLIAYVFVSTRKLEGDSAAYQFLNLTGSAFLMVNSFFYRAYPSSGVNIIWISIAIYTMLSKKIRIQKN